MTDGEAKAASHIVLFYDADFFEADYVAAVLTQRGIDVRRPTGGIGEAMEVLAEELRFDAAVLAYHGDQEAGRLFEVLRHREIPCLLLLEERGVRPETAAEDTPSLPAPFAAFQVANWVLEQRRLPASRPPQSLIAGDRDDRGT